MRVGDEHGLSSSSTLVEKRSVGNVETGEVGDHRLEVEERLEATLRDLGLHKKRQILGKKNKKRSLSPLCTW